MGNPDPKINRLYPVSGGVIQSVVTGEDADGYHKVFVDGLENCMEMLECLRKGELDHCFIEANVCEGGCAKGPASAHWNTSYVKTKGKDRECGLLQGGPGSAGYERMRRCTRSSATAVVSDLRPSEEQIARILRSTGKYTPEDELNCGACGYSTCREKADGRVPGEGGAVHVHALCAGTGRVHVKRGHGCDAEHDLCHRKRHEDPGL